MKKRTYNFYKKKETNQYFNLIGSILSSTLLLYSFILIQQLFKLGSFAYQKLNLNLLYSSNNQIFSSIVYYFIIFLSLEFIACIYICRKNKFFNRMIVGFLLDSIIYINLILVIFREFSLEAAYITLLTLISIQVLLCIITQEKQANKIISTLNHRMIWPIFNIALLYMIILASSPCIGYITAKSFYNNYYVLKEQSNTLILEYLDNQKAIVADYSCKEKDCKNKTIIVHSNETQRIIDLTDKQIQQKTFKKIKYD